VAPSIEALRTIGFPGSGAAAAAAVSFHKPRSDEARLPTTGIKAPAAPKQGLREPANGRFAIVEKMPNA
jgi:hypothetical protein